MSIRFTFCYIDEHFNSFPPHPHPKACEVRKVFYTKFARCENQIKYLAQKRKVGLMASIECSFFVHLKAFQKVLKFKKQFFHSTFIVLSPCFLHTGYCPIGQRMTYLKHGTSQLISGGIKSTLFAPRSRNCIFLLDPLHFSMLNSNISAF